MAPAAKKQKLANGSISTAVATEAVEKTEAAAPPPPSTTQDSKSEKAEAGRRRSLFIRSLPATATTESLTELFSESYPIRHATAVVNVETRQCKGYGFVTFADAEDAQKAKDEFNGRVWRDRKLRIQFAEPRQREKGAAQGAEDAQAKPDRPKREQQLPPKLIVRNLPWSIKDSNQLEKLFLPYGKIKQAYVPRKGHGLMAGFGFIIIRGRKNAERAIEGVNGKEVDGRTLAVDWAVDKVTYQGLQGGTEGKVEGAVSDEDQEGHVGMTDNVDGEAVGDEDDMEDESHESEGSHSSEDDEGVDVKMDDDADGDEVGSRPQLSEDRSTTLFVRNLPFTCTDEGLEDHFLQFGSVRYARVVMDSGTERSKGTGFVCFYNKEDADACLRSAPRRPRPTEEEQQKQIQGQKSILQNEDADPTGQHTMDGRVLQISRALDKSEANRLTEAGVAQRRKRSNDRRRVYLLSEGTISSKSKLWEMLSPSEKAMREASAKQRQRLLESNPSLKLSLTRLSVRNIPRSVDSKELKQLAREAIVGFATDVKSNKRDRLSKEELERGGEEMAEAEKARKQAGTGLVKQAKVVFESAGGGKVSESTGAGRSRGYGFIEYHTHRAALMGLRWLNGHAVGYKVREAAKGKKGPSKEEVQDRKKRLIVEFAIENAQVVHRRQERETKARERSEAAKAGKFVDGDAEDDEDNVKQTISRDGRIISYRRDDSKSGKSAGKGGKGEGDRKRKRGAEDDGKPSRSAGSAAGKGDKAEKKPIDEKLARRNQIIGRKRAMRKARKGGK